jgi:hypothetical protein
MHAGALVQAGGAGGALGIDAELDAGDASAVDLGEGRVEQRERNPASPPRWADGKVPDLGGALRARCARLADRRADDLLAVDGQEPQARVEVRAVALDVVVEPLVERLRVTPPVVGEGLGERGVRTDLVPAALELRMAMPSGMRGAGGGASSSIRIIQNVRTYAYPSAAKSRRAGSLPGNGSISDMHLPYPATARPSRSTRFSARSPRGRACSPRCP